MRNFYICVYPNGDFMGIDMDSGGYPYPTDSLNSTRFFNESFKAYDYLKFFSSLGLKVKRVNLELSDV